MAKIRQSPKLPAEMRQAQLLAAAQKLFVRKGYRGTTTEEIAGKAGLTKGALYFHFKSKEDILFSLVKRIFDRHEAAIEDAIAQSMSPPDFFRLLIQSHVESKLPDYSDVVNISLQAIRIPRIKRYITMRIRKFIEFYVNQVGIKYTRDRNALRDTLIFTLGLAHGLSGMRLIMPSLVDLDSQIRLFDSFYAQQAWKSSAEGTRR